MLTYAITVFAVDPIAINAGAQFGVYRQSQSVSTKFAALRSVSPIIYNKMCSNMKLELL